MKSQYPRMILYIKCNEHVWYTSKTYPIARINKNNVLIFICLERVKRQLVRLWDSSEPHMEKTWDNIGPFPLVGSLKKYMKLTQQFRNRPSHNIQNYYYYYF